MRINSFLNIILLLFLICCATVNVKAQKETFNWHFSDFNRIQFVNNNPVSVASSLYLGDPVSDSSGILLFITNALEVYDVNGAFMQGSPHLQPGTPEGNISKYISVPFADGSRKYYIFYLQYNNAEFHHLKYHVVDMALNGGLGQVIQSKVSIEDSISKIECINQPGTKNFWIVSHKSFTKNYRCRLVNTSGITSSIVTNTVGLDPEPDHYRLLDMKSSNAGKLIGISNSHVYIINPDSSYSFIEVFNFNPFTGVISNRVKTKNLGPLNNVTQFNEVLFSPDDRFLYHLRASGFVTQPCSHYSTIVNQYNTCFTDSAEFLGTAAMVVYYYYPCTNDKYLGHMQMAPNKKIYMPHINGNSLFSIENPNRWGSSSNYTPYVFPVPSGNFTYSALCDFYQEFKYKAVKRNITYSGGCFNNPIQYSITNNDATSVQWNFGDPGSGANNTVTALSPTHIFSAPGIYQITAKLFNGIIQIDSLTEKTEIRNPAIRLLAAYPADTALCSGEKLKVVLNTINGIFRWYFKPVGGILGDIGVMDSLNLNAEGTYYVKLYQYDCGGCEMFDSLKITVKPKPFVNLGFNRNVCDGDSLFLDATYPGASYLWSTGAITPFIWVTLGGDYWVKSEINNNGCIATDTVTITLKPGVHVQLPLDTTICYGQSLVLKPSVANASSYLWSNGSNADSLVVTQTGTYWLFAASPDGCTGRDTINVTVNNKLFTLGSDSTICNSESVTLSPSPVYPNVTYLWSNNSILPSVTVNMAGTYWLQLSDNTGCKFTDTIKINYKTIPGFNLGPDTTICSKDTLLLTANVAGVTNYLWSTGALTQSIKVFQPGIYWSDVIKEGCIFRDSIVLTVKQSPAVNLGPDTTLCEGKILFLNAANPNSTYLWQDGSNGPTYLVTQQGQYEVKVVMNGCIAKDLTNIIYDLKPKFSLGPDRLLCMGNSLILDSKISGVSFLWQDGATNSRYNATHPGLYYLTASNYCGSTTDSIILNNGICELYIPNAFTPNGDNKNDVFKVNYGDNIIDFDMQVFNRYGQLVYKTSDKSKGWDGKVNGKTQAQGNYAWGIRYKTVSGSSWQELRGSVLLLK